LANTTFKLRRPSVAGKAPNTSSLSIGELAINLTDRKLYSSDGSNIFETGSNLTSLSVFSDVSVGNSANNTVINSSSISVKSIIANGGIGTANQVLASNGTGVYWKDASGSVAGSNTQIQFNDSGTANAISSFTFDKSNTVVSVGNSTINSTVSAVDIIPGIMCLNKQTVNTTYTMPVNHSAAMVGPVIVNVGTTITIPDGGRLVII